MIVCDVCVHGKNVNPGIACQPKSCTVPEEMVAGSLMVVGGVTV
jgi:hypothetical protein